MSLFDVSEVLQLAGDLDSGARTAQARVTLAVTKTAFDVEADAKALIVSMDAVDTGNMLNSVSTDVDAFSFEVGPTADYAVYVHEGTSRMPGRPFLANAFDRRLPSLEQALTQIGADLL